jgi:hypothetical protein
MTIARQVTTFGHKLCVTHDKFPWILAHLCG